MIRLDAVAVSSTDMAKTVAFYELLGFTFPKWGPDDKHVEPLPKPGEVRLMIDTAELMEQLTGHKPTPPNHSSFAMVCDSPSEVSKTSPTPAVGRTGYALRMTLANLSKIGSAPQIR